MANFIFLQVGHDPRVELFVQSIRKYFPTASIIQCSDEKTRAVKGVTRLFRTEGDTKNLMTFRLKAFSELEVNAPSIYLDTDMLVCEAFDIESLLKSSDVVICERSFSRNSQFNANFNGMDLSEHAGKTLYEVYPYLACFTVAKSNVFWQRCYESLLSMPIKYHFWYGDQEAIKFCASNPTNQTITFIPESKIACLPEEIRSDNLPWIVHFKGASRKHLMEKFASAILQ